MTISNGSFSSNDHLIDERGAGRILSCSVALLRKWRLHGNGPAYIKVGRLVRYSEADLAAYLDANRKQPAAVGGAQ